MMKKIHLALVKSKYIETHRLQNSVEALEYQKSLWETLQQLVNLERDLNKAKTELASMINIRPGTPFHLVHAPPHANPLPQGFPLDIDLLERIALLDRPELREEDYRKRISIQAIRKARIEMLPNLHIDGGINFDSNQFLLNNTWADAGVRLSVNLFNLIHAPARIRRAHWNKFVVDTRRLALSMAILTQVDVAYLRYFQTAKTLSVSSHLKRVNHRLYRQAQREAQVAKSNKLTLIKRELNALIADLRYQLSYAEWENATGQLLSAIGYNPLGRVNPNQTIRELKHIIHFSLDHVPIPRADLVHFEHGHQHRHRHRHTRHFAAAQHPRLPYHGRTTHAIR